MTNDRLGRLEHDVAALKRRIEGTGAPEAPGLVGLIAANRTDIAAIREEVAEISHKLNRAAWIIAGAAGAGGLGGTWLFDALRSAGGS